MSNKPTVPLLDIALKELVRWQRFALHLPGIAYYMIQTIESHSADRRDIEGQKMALYNKWLGVHPDASWDDVANALEKAEERTIAKEIKDNYCVVKETTIFKSPTSPVANQSLATAHPFDKFTHVSTELERLKASFSDLRQEITFRRFSSPTFLAADQTNPSDKVTNVPEDMSTELDRLETSFNYLKREITLSRRFSSPTFPAIDQPLVTAHPFDNVTAMTPEDVSAELDSLETSLNYLRRKITALSRRFSSPMSPAADQSLDTAHPFDKVCVPEDMSTELEKLETAFNDLRREVMSEVEANIKNGTMQIEKLKHEIRSQKSFSIPSLEAVTTADGLFTTICPYYNFLSCHLIIVIATSLPTEKIASKAEEYNKTLNSFKGSTQVKYLRDKLKPYRQDESTSAKVKIVVEDCWGEQSLGLVEILVKTLFPVKNLDELPWYEVTSGSLILTFMAFDHMTSSLIEYSMEKASFMSLVGVVSLSIGEKLVWESGEENSSFLSFDNCLIQAALANNVEVVAFLLKHTTVNANAASEFHILINLSEEIFYTKSEAEHTLEKNYNAFTKLLEDIEYYSPPAQSGSIHQIIFLKNFLNERVLSAGQSRLVQLPQHLLHKIDSYKHLVVSSKKRIDVKFLANVINKYVPHKLPYYGKVVLTLHSVWGDCSIQYIEQLGELIFTSSLFQEVQLARVQTNEALILTFLAPVRILKIKVTKKDQSMFNLNLDDTILKLLGVISIKVTDFMIYTNQNSCSWYTFGHALSLAEKNQADFKMREAIALLKQINKMPKEFKDAFATDENGNYGFLLNPGATALIIACCNDNINLVRLLLKHNADPNVHGRSTLTPLMYSSGNTQIFKMLIDHGANIDALAFRYNETVLHCACVVGNMQIVKHLLVQRENMIRITDRVGVTPFYYACKYGHVAIVNQLITKIKADPNAQDSLTGWTGLMEASYHGHEAIVKRLVLLKAINLNLRNANEATALMLASAGGHIGIVKLLLEHQADPSLRNKAGDTAFSLSCAFGHKKLLAALLVDDDLLNAQNLKGITALAHACCGGHSEVVEWLLERSADPNISNSQGETPLKIAICYGHINIVKQLLQIDSALNLDVQSANGDTALIAATRQGYFDVVEMLLHKRADPSVRSNNGWTAIMIASFEGHIAIVKQLIKAMSNEDLEIRNDWGATAAFIACMHGRVEIVKLFIQETSVEFDLQDNNGWTPLMSACKRGHGVVDLLLQQNANPNQRENKAGTTVLMIATIHGRVLTVEKLLKHKADPGLQDKNGWTALMYASDKGHVEIVKQLLQLNEGKVSIDFQNNNGKTALILANANSHVSIVKYLLEEKPDPNIQDKQGSTALMKAVCNDQHQTVEWLLQSKADPNIQNNEGRTALWMASAMGSIIVKRLLSKNSNPNIRDGDGTTPLMMAIRNRHLQVIRQLLDSKADPNTRNNAGKTPLILAVQYCPDIVEWLLQEKAHPNIQHTITGETALIIASELGYIDVAQQLLQYKADPNIPDKTGKTSLMAASENDKLELLDCLLQANADPNITNSNGETALILASACNNTNIVQRLLQENVNVNIQEHMDKHTPLMVACDKIHRAKCTVEVVKSLLKKNAKVNIQDISGRTALMIATRRIINEAIRDIKLVECLINSQADPNIQDKHGKTPLLEAITHNRIDIVRLLVQNNADPNIEDSAGQSAMKIARMKNLTQHLEQQ